MSDFLVQANLTPKDIHKRYIRFGKLSQVEADRAMSALSMDWISFWRSERPIAPFCLKSTQLIPISPGLKMKRTISAK